MVSSAGPTNGCDRASTSAFPRNCGTWESLPSPWTACPLDEVDLMDGMAGYVLEVWPEIYSAARIVRDDPRLHAIYITNFACGPDSFILHFFKEKMRGKPYLQIEWTSTAATWSDHPPGGFPGQYQEYPGRQYQGGAKPKTVPPHQRCQPPEMYIPYMAEPGLRRSGGLPGPAVSTPRSLPRQTQETVVLGKKVILRARNAIPASLTTGDHGAGDQETRL